MIFFKIKYYHVSIWRCATWQRRCDVVVVMSHVIIGCEKSHCSPYICYFVSIWSQIF